MGIKDKVTMTTTGYGADTPAPLDRDELTAQAAILLSRIQELMDDAERFTSGLPPELTIYTELDRAYDANLEGSLDADQMQEHNYAIPDPVRFLQYRVNEFFHLGDSE